ncbi:MAG TPA: hypothetical protein VMV82_06050 [Candidatus Dormibacteraeota bacterium]|nr:hypothetical protein [Candidatus Dormibacteraeota bacterium]
MSVTKNFVKAPNHLLTDSTLDVRCRLLALRLLHYARDKATCWPSQQKLADDLGWPLITTKRHFEHLRSQGRIGVRRKARDKQKREGVLNVYDVSALKAGTKVSQVIPRSGDDQGIASDTLVEWTNVSNRIDQSIKSDHDQSISSEPVIRLREIDTKEKDRLRTLDSAANASAEPDRDDEFGSCAESEARELEPAPNAAAGDEPDGFDCSAETETVAHGSDATIGTTMGDPLQNQTHCEPEPTFRLGDERSAAIASPFYQQHGLGIAPEDAGLDWVKTTLYDPGFGATWYEEPNASLINDWLEQLPEAIVATEMLLTRLWNAQRTGKDCPIRKPVPYVAKIVANGDRPTKNEHAIALTMKREREVVGWVEEIEDMGGLKGFMSLDDVPEHLRDDVKRAIEQETGAAA